jgi:hypothetical protein
MFGGRILGARNGLDAKSDNRKESLPLTKDEKFAEGYCLGNESGNEKVNFQAGYWWLMPIILATQEAEIRRIMVHETLSQKYPVTKEHLSR